MIVGKVLKPLLVGMDPRRLKRSGIRPMCAVAIRSLVREGSASLR